MAADLPRRRVAIVTDCDTEVGAAAASRLARTGYQLVLCSMNDASNAVRAVKQPEVRGHAASLLCDFSNPTSAATAVELIESDFGRLDVLVIGPGLSESDDERNNALKCIEAAVPLMSRSGGGAIVLVMSSAGRYRSSYFVCEGPFRSQAARAAREGAMSALTRQLGLELATHRIRANAVALGWIRGGSTQLAWDKLNDHERSFVLQEISLGRLGEPDEAAGVIAFLASEASSYLTGTTIDVNGGWWMS